MSGKDHFYGEGADLLFDDIALHNVRNDGPLRRVSLIMDVHRTFENPFIDIFNRLLLRAVQYNPTVLSILENINTLSPEKVLHA